jgi:hypothetical protein
MLQYSMTVLSIHRGNQPYGAQRTVLDVTWLLWVSPDGCLLKLLLFCTCIVQTKPTHRCCAIFMSMLHESQAQEAWLQEL